MRGLRVGEGLGTYHRFDLGAQPPVESEESLGWLDNEVEKPEWAISNRDATPQVALTAQALDLRCGELLVPTSLRRLATRDELQRRIRSATGCYIDLGHLPVPTSHPGGYLIHFLSDQQWIRHWLLYLDTIIPWLVGGPAL